MILAPRATRFAYDRMSDSVSPVLPTLKVYDYELISILRKS